MPPANSANTADSAAPTITPTTPYTTPHPNQPNPTSDELSYSIPGVTMTLGNISPPSPPTGPLLTAPTNDNGGADADADADEADADTFFHLTSAPPLSAHSNDTDLTNHPFSPLHVAPGISLYDRIPPAAALGGGKEGIWAERSVPS